MTSNPHHAGVGAGRGRVTHGLPVSCPSCKSFNLGYDTLTHPQSYLLELGSNLMHLGTLKTKMGENLRG